MIDECNTWFVSANLSRSNDVGRTEALLLSAQESARSSLKFKNRLLTKGHLAGVCAGKLATSHNLSPLPQRGTGKPLSVHSLLGQLGLCWPVDAYISLSPLAMLPGGKLASQLSRNGKRRSDVGFIWLAVFLSCLLMCVSWLCASYRSPRGAPAGLLPFYPGTDDQTMLLIGRRNARHW